MRRLMVGRLYWEKSAPVRCRSSWKIFGKAVVSSRSRSRSPDAEKIPRLLRRISSQGDLRGWQDEIGAPGAFRAAGHRAVFGGALVLDERDAVSGFDLLEPQRAVGASAGKDHADSQASAVLRQGAKEDVDGHERPVGTLAGTQLQPSVFDGERMVGRNHIHVVGLNDHSFRSLNHRERRSARQNLRQQAGVMRIEMLHEH